MEYQLIRLESGWTLDVIGKHSVSVFEEPGGLTVSFEENAGLSGTISAVGFLRDGEIRMPQISFGTNFPDANAKDGVDFSSNKRNAPNGLSQKWYKVFCAIRESVQDNPLENPEQAKKVEWILSKAEKMFQVKTS